MTSVLITMDSLREHLLSSSDITDIVGDRVHFSRPPIGTSSPHILYRVRRASHEYAFGPSDSGQTTEVALDVHLVTENASSDLSVLTSLAAAVHVLMLSWSAPLGWSVRNIELDNERADSFKEEARFYETHTMSYQIIMEAT